MTKDEKYEHFQNTFSEIYKHTNKYSKVFEQKKIFNSANFIGIFTVDISIL